MQEETVKKKRSIFKTVIVIMGIHLGIQAIIRMNMRKYKKKEKQSKNSPVKYYSVCLNGREIKEESPVKGLVLVASLSGMKYDLSETKIEEDMILEVKSYLSGIDIRVPNGVNVKFQGKSIASKIDNKVPSYLDEAAPTIYFVGKVVMSGVSVMVGQ